MRSTLLLAALAVVAMACGGDGEPVAATTSETTTTVEATTQAPTTTSTTTSAPTTMTSTTTLPPPPTTTTVPPKYPVDEGWVMETIVAELDAATGGLAVDAEGNLYHADFGFGDKVGDVVYKITPDGEVAEFSRPDGLAAATGNKFGPDGTLYQSSFGSGHVFRIRPDGSWDVLTDQLDGPTGLVVTEEGRVFVEDCRQNTLNEVFADGSFEVLLDERLSCPNGMTIDGAGTLYLTNFNNGQLLRFEPDGDGTVEELARLSSPINHAVHFDDGLFLVARNDLRIYRYDLESGELTTIAGTGTVGLGDGPATEAQMGRPNAIAVEADGTLYINHSEARTGNDPVYIRRIRRVG